MTTTTASSRTQLAATGPWRTIDIVTAAMIGVVFGIVYWGWSTSYTALYSPLDSLLGPTIGLVGGMWLIAGVISGLVVRRPGAALFAELLAAAVSALIGNEWGWSTLISGVLQGFGVEVALAIFFFRRFGWQVAALGGMLAALFEFGYEWHAYYADQKTFWLISYAGAFMVSGAVLAGVGGWLITRALAKTGAIDGLPAGREAAADHVS